MGYQIIMTEMFYTHRYPKLGLVDIRVGDGNFLAECGCSGYIESNGNAIIEKNCWIHKGLDIVDLEWFADEIINCYRPKRGEK